MAQKTEAKDGGRFRVNRRLDGRIELVCEHGIGHTIKGAYMGHGCDGCCQTEDFKESKRRYLASRRDDS